jgi:hypothetical protein
MADLQDSIDTIHSLCVDVRQIMPLAEEMLSWLEYALANLREIEDPHARNAEGDVSSAQSALREAISVWFSDYVHRSEDLCRRIAA